MPIADDKIEEVRAASDVVDVVGNYVRLKKRGSGFVGLCPFHNEKTPSFSVNPRMQIFKCFGCGVGGDVFQFLMRVERLTFPEAVRALAENAGIVIPDESRPGPDADASESVYHALRFAARFFHDQLVASTAGGEALKYLIEARGIAPESVTRFGLGFAPDSWDALLRAADDAAIPPSVLLAAGLVVERKGKDGYYDRYRNRVIFPIFSKVGKVIGFGGRVLSPADNPKYINSPETSVYHKSQALYGLYHARQDIRRQGEAILVEGYTDVISLAQAGVGHVVASSGTALTTDQIEAIRKYCDRIVLIYDADNAGAAAAARGIDLILEKGLAVYVVQLPSGEDPDSFVQQNGPEEFLRYLHDNRMDFVTFKYQVERDDHDLNTPESEAAGQRSVIASIARIPDPLIRAQYVRRASEIMGVPEGTLERVMHGLKKRRRRRHGRDAPGGRTDDVIAIPAERPNSSVDPAPEEKTLLRLMLEFGPDIVEFILSNMSLDEFTEGPARDAASTLLDMYQSGDVDKARLLDGSTGEGVQRLAAEVLTDRHEPSNRWQQKAIEVPRLHEDPRQSATSAMALLKLDRIDGHIRRLSDQIRQADSEERVRSLQRSMMELHAMRRDIENRRFLSWNEV